MGKVKGVLLILIGAVLAVFIYENWVLAPHIRLFGRELFQLHTSVIILGFFFLGFLSGVLGCYGWTRARRKAAEASGQEQPPETQGPAQQETQ